MEDEIIELNEEIEECWQTLSREKNRIIGTVQSILSLDGKLSELQTYEVIANLMEVQDLTKKLESDYGYYDDVEVLAQFVKVAKQVLEKYPKLEFSNVLSVTTNKIEKYLDKVGYKYKEPEKDYEYPKQKTKTNRDKIHEEKLRKLDELLLSVSSELSSKAKEELSKRTENNEPKPKKTIAELSTDRERELQSKVEQASNLMILSYYKKKMNL